MQLQADMPIPFFEFFPLKPRLYDHNTVVAKVNLNDKRFLDMTTSFIFFSL